MHLYYKLKVIIKEGEISYLILLLTTIVKINIIITCDLFGLVQFFFINRFENPTKLQKICCFIDFFVFAIFFYLFDGLQTIWFNCEPTKMLKI